MITEPTVEDTISILRGLKERYEVFHGVQITDAALVAAAKLSARYISDRFLPDKAIDLVDEACAMIRTEIDSLPAELDEKQRRIMQLEIELTSLKKEKDEASKLRADMLEEELSDLREAFSAMKARWENEKAEIQKVQKLREEIEAVNAEIQKAQREYDLNKAAELQYGKLPQLQAQLKEQEKGRRGEQGRGFSLLRDKVTEEEISRIVSRWTGIPVTRLKESDREKAVEAPRRAASARRRPGRGGADRVRGHICAAARASPTRTGPSAPSCSSAPRAWARRSWPKRWRRACLTTRRTWCASI